MQKAIPPKDYNIESIHLEITGKCNLMCKYCYNSQFNCEERIVTEMKTSDIKRLIDEAKSMGCKRFTFSGGEPFLRDDFFEIIEYCGDSKVDILSNSKLIDESVIERLYSLPQINEIKISLDGFEQHDIIRVGSSYKDVISTIQELKRRGFKIVINTEVTSLNIHEVFDLYQELKKLKVDRWRVDLPFILGRYKDNYSNYKLPDFERFIELIKNIIVDYVSDKPSFEMELFNIYKSELTPINAIEFDYNTHPCAYRRGSFPLRPNGDMIFCPSMDIPMSNFLEEHSLKEAIDKKFSHQFYNLTINDISECVNCRFINLCNAGCRVDALYYLGKYDAVDPICCNLMPLIEEEIIPILPRELAEFYTSLIVEENEYPERYNIDSLVKERNL
ncbi:radical SAM additional 4Fe4S-binding SPASM domain-containing protein [Lachnospiraceae bacterium XBB2008]|nr:radical SAM additional 4Fe4S-binding SPASM domain-containing protein [Lachnospiraceae bacterium XBB2008]